MASVNDLSMFHKPAKKLGARRTVPQKIRVKASRMAAKFKAWKEWK